MNRFRFHFSSLLVLLASFAFASTPSCARSWIECADGTPCPRAMHQHVRSCCQPAECAAHPRRSGKECVVRTRAGVECNAPVAAFFAAMPTVALLATPPAISVTQQPSYVVSIPLLKPPWERLLEQGHGSRAPPVG